MVYKDLLCPWTAEYVRMLQDQNYDVKNEHPCPNILRTCKQIYHESMPLLYGGNRIAVQVESDDPGPFTITDTLFPGVPFLKLLRSIETVILIDDDAVDTVQFIQLLTAELHPTSTLEVLLRGEKRPISFHPLIGAVLEALKSCSGLAYVKVNLWRLGGQGGGRFWPRRHTLYLESSLGPNLSKEPNELCFRPGSKPLDWERLHVCPLLRLPMKVREKILFFAIGDVHDWYEDVTFPFVEQVHNLRRLNRRTIWPHLRRMNPHLDLRIAQTCHQFTDEVLRTLLAWKEAVFYFDYATRPAYWAPLKPLRRVYQYASFVRVHIRDKGRLRMVDVYSSMESLLLELARSDSWVYPGHEGLRLHKHLHVVMHNHAEVMEGFQDEVPTLYPGQYSGHLPGFRLHDWDTAWMLASFHRWDRVLVEFADPASGKLWSPVATETLEKFLGPKINTSGGAYLEFHPNRTLGWSPNQHERKVPPLVLRPFCYKTFHDLQFLKENKAVDGRRRAEASLLPLSNKRRQRELLKASMRSRQYIWDS